MQIAIIISTLYLHGCFGWLMYALLLSKSGLFSFLIGCSYLLASVQGNAVVKTVTKTKLQRLVKGLYVFLCVYVSSVPPKQAALRDLSSKWLLFPVAKNNRFGVDSTAQTSANHLCIFWYFQNIILTPKICLSYFRSFVGAFMYFSENQVELKFVYLHQWMSATPLGDVLLLIFQKYYFKVYFILF